MLRLTAGRRVRLYWFATRGIHSGAEIRVQVPAASWPVAQVARAPLFFCPMFLDSMRVACRCGSSSLSSSDGIKNVLLSKPYCAVVVPRQALRPANPVWLFHCQRSSYSPSCRSRASPGRRSTNRRRDDGRGQLETRAHLRSWRPVPGGAAAAASGHLALDFGGWHPPHQGSTLISRTSAAVRVDTVAHGRDRR